jgi:hypothetical protein
MNRILQGAKEALAIAKGDAIGERITRGKAERGMPWRVATAEALPGYRIKVRFMAGPPVPEPFPPTC